ncbi:MAG: methylenetetrahydrofolate reductase [Bilophila wadsworthia]
MAGLLQDGRTAGPLEPLFTSVTYGAGGSSQTPRWKSFPSEEEFQFETMAHLTCVARRRTTLQYLQRLRDNGVDNVLPCAATSPGAGHRLGNRRIPPCRRSRPFRQAHYPDMGIGVAGYPAPHPESPSFASDCHTVAKIREGADFRIAQLFFDVREYLHFVTGSATWACPSVIPGILPIQSLDPSGARSPVRREHPWQALSRP